MLKRLLCNTIRYQSTIHNQIPGLGGLDWAKGEVGGVGRTDTQEVDATEKALNFHWIFTALALSAE